MLKNLFLNIFKYVFVEVCMDNEAKKERILNTLLDKRYKILLIIPIVMLLFSLIYLYSFYNRTGDIMLKDVTLTGGASITVYTNETITISDIEKALLPKFKDISARLLTDLSTGKQIAFSVEAKTDLDDLKSSLEEILGYKLTEENSSMEFTGSSLGESFYKELIRAMIIAFILMSIVVFIIFRVTIPCLAVVFAAFSDIIVTLAVVDFLEIRVSTAGIAAFLMLIGYSVDTDMLLTTRVLKRKEKALVERMIDSMKTGMTMTLTSILAVLLGYFVAVSTVLKQVFLIISIGLFVDMVTTWLGNTSMLKWYCDKKGIS